MNVGRHFVIKQPHHHVGRPHLLRRYDMERADPALLINKQNAHPFPQREVLGKKDMPFADQRPGPGVSATAVPRTRTGKIDSLQPEVRALRRVACFMSKAIRIIVKPRQANPWICDGNPLVDAVCHQVISWQRKGKC